jgi:hypothetical protein
MALGSSSVGMGLPSWIVEEVVGMPEEDRERFLDMLLNGAEFLKAARRKHGEDLEVAKFEKQELSKKSRKRSKP